MLMVPVNPPKRLTTSLLSSSVCILLWLAMTSRAVFLATFPTLASRRISRVEISCRSPRTESGSIRTRATKISSSADILACEAVLKSDVSYEHWNEGKTLLTKDVSSLVLVPFPDHRANGNHTGRRLVDVGLPNVRN